MRRYVLQRAMVFVYTELWFYEILKTHKYAFVRLPTRDWSVNIHTSPAEEEKNYEISYRFVVLRTFIPAASGEVCCGPSGPIRRPQYFGQYWCCGRATLGCGGWHGDMYRRSG